MADEDRTVPPPDVHPEEGTLTHGGVRDERTLTHGGIVERTGEGTLTHGGVVPHALRSTAREGLQSGKSTQAPGADDVPTIAGAEEAPVAREWAIGDLIDGRYEVRALLGRGGMGQVVRVFHREWGVDLAVKTPLPKLVDNAAARARFVREAETWVALGLHPNVVGCWYVRELDGLPRLFLDHVSGGSLKQAMREGRILSSDLALVIDLTLQIADGLAHSHRHGVVHRDVKPANVLVTGDGRLQVTDFGLVRRVDDPDVSEVIESARSGGSGGAPRSEAAATHGHTMTGAGLGTPEYAAPEQWTDAHTADARADVYALGVTLFELLAGRRPFDDPAHPEPSSVIIARHMMDPAPDVRSFAPGVPEPLTRLVARCLEKKPNDRPSDMTELRDELAALYTGLADGRKPRPEPRPARLRAGALNNRAVSYWDLGRPAPARDAWDEAIALDPFHAEATYNRALVAWREGESLAPLLERLEELRDTDPSASLRAGLLQLERLACEPALRCLADALEAPAHAADPLAWRALAGALLGLGRDLDAAEAYAEAVVRAPDDQRTRALRDGLRAGQGPARAVRARDVAALLGWPEETTLRAMAATPDGRTLFLAAPDLTASQGGPGNTRLLVLAAGALAPLLVRPAGTVAPAPSNPGSTPGVRRITGPVRALSSPPSSLPVPTPLARAGDAGLVAALKAISAGAGLGGTGGGAPDVVARLLRDLPTAAPSVVMHALGNVQALAVTPDGAIGASVTADGRVEQWVLRTGGCRRSFERPGKLHVAVALVPDGTRAVVAAGDGSLALWDLEEMDLPGVKPRDLPAEGAISLAACAKAPRIASGHADGRVLVWEIGAGTKAASTLAFRAGGRVESLAWSPDGALLAAACGDGKVHLRDMGRQAGTAVDAHVKSALAIAFSPDGATLTSGGADHALMGYAVAELRKDAGAAPRPGGPVRARRARVLVPGFDATRQLAVLSGGVLVGMAAGRAVAMPRDADRSLQHAPVMVCRVQEAAEHEAQAVRFEELIESARQALARRDHALTLAFAGAARAVQGFGHDPEALALEARAAVGQQRRRLRDAWLHGGVGWHPRPLVALGLAGRMLVTCAEDSILRVFDREAEQELLALQPHRAAPTALAVSPDAMHAVSGDATGEVWLSSLTGAEPRQLGKHAGPVHAVAFLDDRRVATTSGDSVRVWDIAAIASAIQTASLDRGARSLCASGGRAGLACGRELYAWDARLGATPRLLGKCQADIELVTAGPSGELLLCASADRSLSLWRPGSDQPVASYVGHEAPVRGIAMTRDERFALSASADGAVIAWELAKSAPHRMLPRAGEGLHAIALDEAGHQLLTAGQQVRQWDLDWEHLPPG